MKPGILHKVKGNEAHRAVNIGKSKLSFVTLCQKDIGHDYDFVLKKGFKKRIFKSNNQKGYTTKAL